LTSFSRSVVPCSATSTSTPWIVSLL
jgi:hypothetical protein